MRNAKCEIRKPVSHFSHFAFRISHFPFLYQYRFHRELAVQIAAQAL
jgi:hypothetical protein